MNELHLAARRYLGVPHVHRARNTAIGLDCVGLGVLAARDCGWTVVDLENYSRNPKDGVLERMLEENCGAPVCVEPVRLEDLRVNDIVSLHFDDARVKQGRPSMWAVRHVGIIGEYDGVLTLIHTTRAFGRVVEHRIDDDVLACFAAVYRRLA